MSADGATQSCGDVPSTIFAPTCGVSSCHDSKASSGSLDLVSPDVFGRLSGVKPAEGSGVLIDPGRNPQKSVLYLKLLSPPPFGQQMPLGGKLDTTSQACVAAWITSGGTSASDAAPPTDGSALPSDGGTTSDAQAAGDTQTAGDAPAE